MPANYSVLMSVYYKENPAYLRQSMLSIYNQTIPTNNFVVVCDGPLTDELNKVLFEMKKKFGPRLCIHRLPQNGGLGNALKIGIKKCTNEFIARMDSDDISRPDRCEKEIKMLITHPEISVLGGFIEEFIEDTNHVCSIRMVPEKQDAILQFAKKRNPFNHVSVMYRKSAIESVGSYESFFLLEDYYLWIRMLNNGYQGYNLQEPLVWVRVGKDMYKRRGGWKYFLSQRKLLCYMHQSGFITYSQYLMGTFIRLGVAMAPNNFRSFVFNHILRK